ncbi:hypothetical protein C5167_040757 [Papaver somniferum]|uniref:Small ribosomal subunit protein eS4 N-terminal domain-containing protein n=1 Tax=Papaver somniferum TaxID=3469 RepID=A0A4Y7IK27_PAPSO|nr:hypothetical protein C5167_040757 [Papaver somniferum]
MMKKMKVVTTTMIIMIRSLCSVIYTNIIGWDNVVDVEPGRREFESFHLEMQYFHDHATFTVVVGLNQQCEQVNAPDPIINTCSDFYKFWQATHDLHEAINLCYAASIATNPMEDNLGDNLEARGLKKHLKRINALKHCMLGKLGGAFAPKPSSGPYKSRFSFGI